MNGVFKKFCIEAKNSLVANNDEEYYFVVDEINRANLSAVFGETLSMLEMSYRDYRKKEDGTAERNLTETQYSELERSLEKKDASKVFYDETLEGKFGIPRNIHFIGMMNDVDKSIDAFDLALRRRFAWHRMDCDYDVVEDECRNSEKYKYDRNSVETFIESCKKLNGFISGEDGLNLGSSYEFGHSNFLKIIDIVHKDEKKEIETRHKEELFEKFLVPTLKEYLRGQSSSEQVIEENLEKVRNIFVG